MKKEFMNINHIDLGVPTKWLRDEAVAGRIPHVKVGKSLMVNVEQVIECLRSRAASEMQSTCPLPYRRVIDTDGTPMPPESL